MGFYDTCAKIIDANEKNEAVQKIMTEIKKCQMMYNCSVFTNELRRYITELRETNPYNNQITEYKKQIENNYAVVDLEEHKAKVLRKLLPWEQQKLFMYGVITSLSLHQKLTEKDIKKLIKGMVEENERVFNNYITGAEKLLAENIEDNQAPQTTEAMPKKKRFGFFKK